LALPHSVFAVILQHRRINGKENIVRVDVLTVGMFQSNCFIVSCETTKEAIIIDAGDEGERIVDHVKREKLDVKMIVCTHGHIDHVAGLPEVRAAFDAPVLMHKDEIVLYEHVDRQAMLFGVPAPGTVNIERFVGHGDKIAFGNLAGEVIHTPGHSPGGISIAFPNEKPPAIFVGDVLFRGSIGRTDLMGASERQMAKTLKDIILDLPDDMVVYPGHGPETTIRIERKSNPFLLELDNWDM
jgi:glyoxylase-like metal-dependent hydrolase (beta-lactamase superfamily II)